MSRASFIAPEEIGHGGLRFELNPPAASLAVTRGGVEGEGMIGTMAAVFLKGHVSKYEGKKGAADDVLAGDVALRDLKISTKGAIELSASFGHA